jgi:hypothetical protein
VRVRSRWPPGDGDHLDPGGTQVLIRSDGGLPVQHPGMEGPRVDHDRRCDVVEPEIRRREPSPRLVVDLGIGPWFETATPGPRSTSAGLPRAVTTPPTPHPRAPCGSVDGRGCCVPRPSAPRRRGGPAAAAPRPQRSAACDEEAPAPGWVGPPRSPVARAQRLPSCRRARSRAQRTRAPPPVVGRPREVRARAGRREAGASASEPKAHRIWPGLSPPSRSCCRVTTPSWDAASFASSGDNGMPQCRPGRLPGAGSDLGLWTTALRGDPVDSLAPRCSTVPKGSATLIHRLLNKGGSGDDDDVDPRVRR